MIQDTLNGPASYKPAANVTVRANPTTTEPNTITEAFIYYGEGPGAGAYNDSKNIPTIGIGMNLRTLAASTDPQLVMVRNELAADVLANCSNSGAFPDLADFYQDHTGDFVLSKAKGGGVNVAGILNVLQTSQASGGLLKATKAQAMIPVLTLEQQWSLFRLLLTKYINSAMSGYTKAGGDWSSLTAYQQALLVDLNYNVGSNFNQMDRDIAAGDLVRAAFDLVNAYRTTQGPNSLGLNIRTEADLQMLLHTATNPNPLGRVVTQAGN
jgi:GH24 family phage-related lysozyme (muramidase)